MINKVVLDAQEAVKDIKDNSTLMLGGFGLRRVSVEEIEAATEGKLIVEGDIPEMSIN